jgi:ABC-type multidrug transport system permease subunit
MALILSTTLAQAAQPVFLQQRDLFEARERPKLNHLTSTTVVCLIRLRLGFLWCDLVRLN